MAPDQAHLSADIDWTVVLEEAVHDQPELVAEARRRRVELEQCIRH